MEVDELSYGFGSTTLETLNDLRETVEIASFPVAHRIGAWGIVGHVAGRQAFLKHEIALRVIEQGLWAKCRPDLHYPW